MWDSADLKSPQTSYLTSNFGSTKVVCVICANQHSWLRIAQGYEEEVSVRCHHQVVNTPTCQVSCREVAELP